MIDKSVYDSESVTEEQGMQNEPLVNKFIVHSKLPETKVRNDDKPVKEAVRT